MTLFQIQRIAGEVAERAVNHDDRTLLISLVVSVISVLVAVGTKLYVDMRKDRKEYVSSLKGIGDSIDKGIETNTANMKEIVSNSHQQLQTTMQSTLNQFAKSIEDNNRITEKIVEKLKL